MTARRDRGHVASRVCSSRSTLVPLPTTLGRKISCGFLVVVEGVCYGGPALMQYAVRFEPSKLADDGLNATDAISFLGQELDASVADERYRSGWLNPADGLIYCVPCSMTRVMVIDPAARTS